MPGGDLASIGSITVDYRRPNIVWNSAPTSKGYRPCSIDGLMDLAGVDALSELVANDALQETYSDFVGVKEWIEFTGTLANKTGYYLLLTFSERIEHQFMFGGPTGPTSMSLSAVYLGDLA